jgi:hypothetical protein
MFFSIPGEPVFLGPELLFLIKLLLQPVKLELISHGKQGIICKSSK